MLQVPLPFHREEILLPGIAPRATGDHVGPGAPAAADNRHDVVHGQLPGRELILAVVAPAGGAAVFPPLAPAQFLGLALFAGHVLFWGRGEVDFVHTPMVGPGGRGGNRSPRRDLPSSQSFHSTWWSSPARRSAAPAAARSCTRCSRSTRTAAWTCWLRRTPAVRPAAVKRGLFHLNEDAFGHLYPEVLPFPGGIDLQEQRGLEGRLVLDSDLHT